MKKQPSYDIQRNLLKQRAIVMPHTIDFDTVKKLTEIILVLDSLSRKPIKIWINCLGGSVWAGLSLIDVMKWTKCPIITVGTGIIASMAVPVFVSGDVRFLSRNSFIMLHPISTTERDYLPFVKSSVEHAEKLQEIYENILRKNTKIPKEIYEEYLRKEVYISAEQAKKWRIIDGILKKGK